MLPGIRIRRLAAAAALAAVAFPLTGVALAGSALASPASVVSEVGPGPAQSDDPACAAFPDQAAAQAALDAGTGDAALLDPDHDGRACEDHPYPAAVTPSQVPPPATAQVPLVPVGAVPAGDGSAAALLGQGSPTMATTLDRAGGAAFVGGITMVAALAVAGIATLALSGRMLLAGLRTAGLRTAVGSDVDRRERGADEPVPARSTPAAALVPAPRRAPDADRRPTPARPDPVPPMVRREAQHAGERR